MDVREQAAPPTAAEHTPQEHDPAAPGMLANAATQLGNGALQRRMVQRRAAQRPVVQRQPIGDHIPAQVDLRSVGVGFTLPQGKVLASGMGYTVKTAYASQLSLDATPAALTVSASPAVMVDPVFPVQNMDFRGVTYDFATARPRVHVSTIGGLTEGFIDVTGRVRHTVEDLIHRAVAGSAMAVPGYNPLTDPDLTATLSRIASNFSALPSAGGAGNGQVGAGDLHDVTVRASLAMRREFLQQAGPGGIRIPAGGSFDVALMGGGSLAELARARDAAGAMSAARIQGLTMSSDSVFVLSKGQPVAKLQSLTVSRGGVVRIDQMELMGRAREGQDVETLLRLLGGTIALASRGVPDEAALNITAHSDATRATIVPGLTRGLLEDALTHAVQGLLRDNAHAIPGVNLAQALGIQ